MASVGSGASGSRALGLQGLEFRIQITPCLDPGVTKGLGAQLHRASIRLG